MVFADIGLRALAQQLHQVIDCQILGVPQGQSLGANVPDILEIVASDSTEWILRTGTQHGWRLDLGSSLFERPGQ